MPATRPVPGFSPSRASAGWARRALSLAAAEAARDHLADGVAWVPLAALPEPDLVVPAIGRAAGLSHIEGLDADQVVTQALRDRHLLLVLDNLEQLLPAATELVRLLQSCPRLVILASSRAPLRVRAEHEHPVRPLALPTRSTAEGDLSTLQDVADSPAAALFIARAQAVRPGFELTATNAQAIADLCTGWPAYRWPSSWPRRSRASSSPPSCCRD